MLDIEVESFEIDNKDLIINLIITQQKSENTSNTS